MKLMQGPRQQARPGTASARQTGLLLPIKTQRSLNSLSFTGTTSSTTFHLRILENRLFFNFFQSLSRRCRTPDRKALLEEENGLVSAANWPGHQGQPHAQTRSCQAKSRSTCSVRRPHRQRASCIIHRIREQGCPSSTHLKASLSRRFPGRRSSKTNGTAITIPPNPASHSQQRAAYPIPPCLVVGWFLCLCTLRFNCMQRCSG